jgi:outer membrane immunogenic protein
MRKCVCVASRIAFACALYGASLAPVAAADLGGYPDYRPPRQNDGIVVPAVYFTWTGLYLGGNLGYGWGSTSSKNGPGSNGYDGAYDSFVLHPYGLLGGAQIGYNWQTDTFLFGLEADAGYLGTNDAKRTSTGFADTDYGGYGTLTARIGYADSRWLLYTKGGLAFANITNQAGAISGGAEDLTDKTTKDELQLGWTIGGGMEYAFRPDWSMKIEYLYMDFGDVNSTNVDGDLFIHDNSLHTVKVGFNYRLQDAYEPLK